VPTDTPVPPPIVQAITPDTGVNTAAVNVTISGLNFQAGCSASLDGVPLAVSNCAPTLIQAAVPVGIVAGYYDLTVTNPDSQSDVLPNAYTATNPIPVVAAINPNTWFTTTDRAVTITGGNFRNTGAPGALRARLDGVPLLNVTYVDQNTLTAVVPCRSAGMGLGTYTLYVTNPGPTDPTGSLANAFTIVADTPPAAPANLRAAAGESQIVLGWDPNSEIDLAGYNVYRTDSGFLTAVTENSYRDAAVTNGTTYTYYVTAIDVASNESAASNLASAQPYDITPYMYTTSVTCTGSLVGSCSDAGGPPDNVPVGIDNSDTITLDFGTGRGIIDGPGSDMVFYEWLTGGSIYLDYITIDLSADGVTWYTVFEWDGDNPGDVSGTNVDGYASDGDGELEDEPIPQGDLYPYPGSGIEIDIGAVQSPPPPGYSFHLVRFTYPAGGTDYGQIDAVERLN